jgi:L-threonine kinase
VQGELDDQPFMITFPVDLWVTAVATPSAGPGVRISSAHKVKARRVAELFLRRHGLAARGVTVSVNSPVPEGKGLASSSADIVAVCRALGDLFGIAVSDAELGELACRIEPSDAVMFDHPVAFDYLRGRVLTDPRRRLPVRAVLVDPGGLLDTLGFRRSPYTAAERRLVRQAYQLAMAGLVGGDLAAVGAAATLSAQVNQRRHAKPQLDQLIRICDRLGGVGVCVAHSGVVAAMLFAEAHAAQAERAAQEVVRHLPSAATMCLTSACGEVGS